MSNLFDLTGRVVPVTGATGAREKLDAALASCHAGTRMDDLGKPAGITPGYFAIGRRRGLILGLRHGE